jgi:nicotinamide phosphoribosyltransferase
MSLLTVMWYLPVWLVNGEHREIFKDPKTDKGGVKKSHRGLLRVDKTDGKYTVVDRLTKEEYFADRGHLLPVMENSNFPVLPIPSISDIRESLHGK